VIRGLIVGKFCPPHAGHRFLIETALAQVDHLDVLVCSHLSHTIPGELRGQWLREIHPRACVKVIDDPGHDDDSQFWAEYTIRLLGRVPDIVFSSEDYGEPYARLMKCRHIMVDRERMRVPISGRMIRSAPFEHWKYLDPCVRAYYLRRISVVGAESTGKTTLARALAEHYDTAWVPEYAREYCERLQRSGVDLWTYHWRSEEFTEIARQQQQAEDRTARAANRILICDTDALTTSIWHERYLTVRSPEIEKILTSAARHDLYLLADCDIPFVQDGLRDGESIREWMTRRFEQVLSERKFPWVKIAGSRERRIGAAIQEIDKLFTSNHPPLSC
jgi:HTH-type transcriptional repressor of NAD biosynthesis genes